MFRFPPARHTQENAGVPRRVQKMSVVWMQYRNRTNSSPGKGEYQVFRKSLRAHHRGRKLPQANSEVFSGVFRKRLRLGERMIPAGSGEARAVR
ncbi:hypothetical protein GCM10009628_22550 [Paeniglutamicibacter kerguelensis]